MHGGERLSIAQGACSKCAALIQRCGCVVWPHPGQSVGSQGVTDRQLSVGTGWTGVVWLQAACWVKVTAEQCELVSGGGG